MRRLFYCCAFLFFIFFISSINFCLANKYTVTSLSNSGSGTLNSAITQANSHLGPDTIVFSVSGTINLTSFLPSLTDNGTFIDGSTAPGGCRSVELNCTSAGGGLFINSNNNIINCLVINRALENGIDVASTKNNQILNNYIGTNLAGNSDLGNSTGISLHDDADSNLVSNNLISGNINGVEIINSFYNTVKGNLIGTAASGNSALQNDFYGISLTFGSDNCVIDSNLISGNGRAGIFIDVGSQLSKVVGNRIGINSAGTADLGNKRHGIELRGTKNIIGDTLNFERNVISGNDSTGIYLTGDSNTVQNNYIGLGLNGSVIISNTVAGIKILSARNQIGLNTEAAKNVITGNGLYGVELTGLSAKYNSITGNFVGLLADGTRDTILHTQVGVYIHNAARYNQIGSDLENRNVISGNSRGIEIEGSSTDSNQVKGNIIGLSALGTVAAGNLQQGIFIHKGARFNQIGNSALGEGNLISGNLSQGIEIADSTTNSNVIEGNFIGLDISGANILGNSGAGVKIDGITSIPARYVAGTLIQQNIISGNSVGLSISRARDTEILGNYIGTDSSGSFDLGNTSGIDLCCGRKNIIGGATFTDRNIISGNVTGILIRDLADSNKVIGNFIGTDVNGTAGLGNSGNGIELVNARFNTLGDSLSAKNIISANGNGIKISDLADSNRIIGNFIGTNVNGTASLGNSGNGIELINAQFNTIGDSLESLGNLIGTNSYGIKLSHSQQNQILSNFVGTDSSGTLNLGNLFSGVILSNGSRNNSLYNNKIAYNLSDGISVLDDSTDFNSFLNNKIYENQGLGIDLAPDGVTPNDTGDLDTGPNQNQNFPAISEFYVSGGNTILEGTAPSSSRIDFYMVNNSASPQVSPDSSGYGEGFSKLGDTTASLAKSFTYIAPSPLSPDIFITALTTDLLGNTSEFSYNVLRTYNFIAMSDVDLIIEDELGRIIKLDYSNIPGAVYDTTKDYNNDGKKDDWIRILALWDGVYTVKVVAEPDAPLGSKYSVIAGRDSAKAVLTNIYSIAPDSTVPAPGDSDVYLFDFDFCSKVYVGDVKNNGGITPADLVWMINFLLKKGPPPQPTLLAGDLKGDCQVAISDLIYMINYLFKKGWAPPHCPHCP